LGPTISTFGDAAAGVRVRTAFPIEHGDTVLTKQAFIAGSDPADFDYGMLKPVIRTDCIRRLALACRETARLSEDIIPTESQMEVSACCDAVAIW
jgi:hypothetical protein